MVIYWHKRDFRLLDNQALNRALELSRANNLEFLSIMGVESDLMAGEITSYEFGEFWEYGVMSAILPLYLNYNYFGVITGLFCEPILEYLARIQSQNTIQYLVSHQEHGTSGTYKRDKAVASFCKINNIIWIEVQPHGVIRSLVSRDSRDSLVKKYLNGSVLSIPKFTTELQKTDNQTFWTQLKIQNTNTYQQFETRLAQLQSKYELQPTSEKQALVTILDFTSNRARGYRGGISSPNSALTSGSRLSQYLAFGAISPRFVYQNYWAQIKSTDDTKLRSGMLGSMQRLFWREHFVQRLETSPDMPTKAINPDYNEIGYSHNLDYFKAFQTGTTGEPIIDACIRCLLKTGFINFRMRAMIVSYATFGLDLDWRQVGKFLATVFLDYEPGIHWSQIQMQSGVTGINTIRVYSPTKQLLEQDPDCVFVKKWIPELLDIEIQDILDYTKTDLSNQTAGQYPSPVVDFKAACKINKLKTYGTRKTSNRENAQATFVKHGSRKRVMKA